MFSTYLRTSDSYSRNRKIGKRKNERRVSSALLRCVMSAVCAVCVVSAVCALCVMSAVCAVCVRMLRHSSQHKVLTL